jgi:hypothetical protein
MARRLELTKQLGIRCNQETIDRCIRAGGGKGETAGARVLMDLGWQQFTGKAAAQLPLADRIYAIAAEIEQLSRYSVSGSGAGLLSAATTEAIDALRAAGAGCIVTSSGLLVPGVTPAGADALLVLDLEAGQLAITGSDGTDAVVELGEALPAVGSLAALVSGVLSRAWETVAAGRTPADAPPGRRTDWGLVVIAADPSDGLSRVELPGAVLCLHSLQLLQLASELFGLLARRSAASLQDRAELEQLLARPSAEAPPVALSWSRTHGE